MDLPEDSELMAPAAVTPEALEADNPVGMASEVPTPEQETSSPTLQKLGEMDYKVSGETIPETTPAPAESFAGPEPVETVGSQEAPLSTVQRPEPQISIQQVEESSVSETETAAAQSSTGVALGKGIDIGTANLLAAVQDESGKIIVKKQRNAFVDIPADSHQKAMLTRLKVPYVVQGKQMYALSDAAFELANVLNENTRRPMQAGLLSPKEAAAVPVMKLLIENILGQPRPKGEPVSFRCRANRSTVT